MDGPPADPSTTHHAPAGGPPVGWYPDPGGTDQWRRWDGTTWADATMPYGPPPPDPRVLQRERMTWQLLRAVAPWGLVAPAVAAACVASETASFAALRHWIRPWLHAYLHGQPTPPVPTATVSTSAVVSAVSYLVTAVAAIGLWGWLRFTVASLRTAALARYPNPHHELTTCLLFFLPFAGPLVALSASRSCLPRGHEARRSLTVGWWLVVAGELTWVGLIATVLATPSLSLAWAAAIGCAACWLAAAAQLPVGLESIAEDHAALGVRLGPAPS